MKAQNLTLLYFLGLVRKQLPLSNNPEDQSHLLQETEKKQACSGCYHENVLLHGRTVAKNKTTKVKTRCQSCSKYVCL